MHVTIHELRRQVAFKVHAGMQLLDAGDFVEADKMADKILALEDIIELAEILGTDTVEILEEV